MARLVDAIDAATAPFLWLDSDAYATRLFASPPPWLGVAALVGWRRRAQGLLRSDVVTLPVDAVCAAWLAANTTLAQEMLIKRRNLFPLKTLLADSALRAHLAELARALRQSFGALPLAVIVPAPHAWVGIAHAAVRGADETIDVDDDDAESAAVHVADFLRTFADCRVDALLLDETASTPPPSARTLPLYQATLNVAANYRWDTGLRLAVDAGDALAAAGITFAITARACDVTSGIAVAVDFWSGQAVPPLPSRGFRYAEMPAAMAPEGALERVAALRAAS